jgi:hypothetical protein
MGIPGETYIILRDDFQANMTEPPRGKPGADENIISSDDHANYPLTAARIPV